MTREIVDLCDKTTGIKVGQPCGRVVQRTSGRIGILFGVLGPKPEDPEEFIEDLDEALKRVTPVIRHFCSAKHANFWLHHIVVMHPEEVQELVTSDESGLANLEAVAL
jgi:hypothetical protein